MCLKDEEGENNWKICFNIIIGSFVVSSSQKKVKNGDGSGHVIKSKTFLSNLIHFACFVVITLCAY